MKIMIKMLTICLYFVITIMIKMNLPILMKIMIKMLTICLYIVLTIMIKMNLPIRMKIMIKMLMICLYFVLMIMIKMNLPILMKIMIKHDDLLVLVVDIFLVFVLEVHHEYICFSKSLTESAFLNFNKINY